MMGNEAGQMMGDVRNLRTAQGTNGKQILRQALPPYSHSLILVVISRQLKDIPTCAKPNTTSTTVSTQTRDACQQHFSCLVQHRRSCFFREDLPRRLSRRVEITCSCALTL